MKAYNWANNIVGWVVFIIASATYLLTIEPTASFWDCSEFISSAYKLEVGHPPGSPIFMLVANLFTHFASEPSQVAKMVNCMSALFSALTILFLFWTITHLTRKLIIPDKAKEMTLSQMITILGSGAVGALAYTFSDSFWFSAVEGEVYAFSSLMTGLVFWLILKWEDVADEPHSDRWLILIAYLTGVSIAVHLLNLLCIPAIVLVYYFRKYSQPTFKGSILALLISFGIVAATLYGLIQGVMEVCGWFELLFVNVFKLPYNSGVIFYIILVFGVLAWAIWETMKNDKNSVPAKIGFILSVFLLGIPFFGGAYVLGVILLAVLAFFLFRAKKVNMVALNTVLICLLVMTIGYSSYMLIVIRSTSNTPMDQNSPEDVFTLRTYLSREQYGETPLIYGQTFVSEVKYEEKDGYMVPVQEEERNVWTRIVKRDSTENDKYFVSDRKKHYVFVDELNTFFPRMYSSEPRHIQGYKDWTNFKGQRVKVTTPQGQKTVLKPTFGENLQYFISYQVCFMYWRYFLWNFSGRQNDIQGNGDILNGNWITGFKFIDDKVLGLGPQDNLPDSIAKNKGHNKFYMLPLLLGLLGLFFQVFAGKRGVEHFWVIFTLFFMTGLAIVIYVNQPPFQPRERDYSYAGSFYAFCIWIGLGVVPLAKALERLKLSPLVASAVSSFLALLVPLQMVSQTWDDHDRSKRYFTRDFGYNYLTTCEPNAIIFTNGDNDTFPLWYGQEVEGYRRDVRVCNLSYLQTDWYIDQMKRQAYTSDPLPIDWKGYDYIQGKHDGAYVFPQKNYPIEVGEVLDRIKSDDVRTKQIQGISQELDNVESNQILIPVDSAGVIANGVVKPENADWISGYMLVDLSERKNKEGKVVVPAKKMLYKHELIILDMLKNNSDWSRPIYYAMTVGSEQYLRLDPYFRQDGIAYRIMPFPAVAYQPTGTDEMYDNIMNKYRYGGLSEQGLYIDENAMRMCRTFRALFGELAKKLVDQGDSIRAKAVLDKSLQEIPSYSVPYDYMTSIDLAESYDRIGEKEKAKEIYTALAELYLKNLNWYSRLNDSQYRSILEEINKNLQYLQPIFMFFHNNDEAAFDKYANEYDQYYRQFGEHIKRLQKRGGVNR